MRKALAAVALLSVAFAVLFATLWIRDTKQTATADALRAAADDRCTAAIKARDKALAMLAQVEAESRSCRADVAAVERSTVETERQACNALMDAERARGALDVEPTDLSAVVEALRRRRR